MNSHMEQDSIWHINRVIQCSPGWHGTIYTDQDRSVKPRNTLLELKACVTMLNATVQVFFSLKWNWFAEHLQPQVGMTDTESRFSQTWKKALVNHN